MPPCQCPNCALKGPTFANFWLNEVQEVDIDSIPAEDRDCRICYAPYAEALPTEITVETEAASILALLPFPQGKAVHRAPDRAVKLPCGHQFGHDCLMTIFRDTTLCPLCRRQFFRQGTYNERLMVALAVVDADEQYNWRAVRFSDQHKMTGEHHAMMLRHSVELENMTFREKLFSPVLNQVNPVPLLPALMKTLLLCKMEEVHHRFHLSGRHHAWRHHVNSNVVNDTVRIMRTTIDSLGPGGFQDPRRYSRALLIKQLTNAVLDTPSGNRQWRKKPKNVAFVKTCAQALVSELYWWVISFHPLMLAKIEGFLFSAHNFAASKLREYSRRHNGMGQLVFDYESEDIFGGKVRVYIPDPCAWRHCACNDCGGAMSEGQSARRARIAEVMASYFEVKNLTG